MGQLLLGKFMMEKTKPPKKVEIDWELLGKLMMEKTKPPKKVEIDWELLKKIAEYYQFPSTVFFLPINYKFEGKTRDNCLEEKLKKIEKLKEELHEMIEDL